jgi:hypothetical protein
MTETGPRAKRERDEEEADEEPAAKAAKLTDAERGYLDTDDQYLRANWSNPAATARPIVERLERHGEPPVRELPAEGGRGRCWRCLDFGVGLASLADHEEAESVRVTFFERSPDEFLFRHQARLFLAPRSPHPLRPPALDPLCARCYALAARHSYHQAELRVKAWDGDRCARAARALATQGIRILSA